MKPFSQPNRVKLPRWGVALLLAAFILHPSTFILSAAAAAPDPLIPGALAADRYKALASRSPFSPPTAEAPPPTVTPTSPPPGWGEKYTLGGVAQFGAGYKVTLNPKNPVGAGASASAGANNVNPAERLVVITGQPNGDNITLVSVQWSDDAKQTRALLTKNGVPAQFAFDPTALSNARGNAATAASVPAPRNSASGPNFAPPPGMVSGLNNNPANPFPGGTAGGAPTPGIVRSPATRAPIRPPPPTGTNGMPLMAPPPPVAVRASPPVPGNNAADDDD